MIQEKFWQRYDRTGDPQTGASLGKKGLAATSKRTIFAPMRILLAAATSFELRASLDKMPVNPRIQVDPVITGVGLVSATYQLQRAITLTSPDLVIQAGIAGCFDPAYALGSLVVVGEEAIGDLGVEENGIFKDLFDLSLLKEDSLPYHEGRLINPDVEQYNLLGWPFCKAISVNEVSTRRERIVQLTRKYDPLIESMEGAALHFVCLQEKIPFLQIRALSNYIGERDKSKWQMAASIQHLNEGLLQWMDALTYKIEQ